MGRGARPLHAWWRGERLGYVDARKRIYVPLYARAVLPTEAWRTLQALFGSRARLVLRDFDGYDHAALGMSLTDVLHAADRRMGHAFVLAMLLLCDPALSETALDLGDPGTSPPAGGG